MTHDEKIQMLHQYQPAIPRLGVAAYKHGTEAAHGIAWLGKATTFPQPLGLASTWDPVLLEEVGKAIGEEARGFYRRDPAKNGLTLWTPTVDLERDPRWGRTEEGWGEDPYLVGETAGALVRGIQGDHPTYLRAAATLKHFLANNHEKDRGSVSVTIDPRNLNEYYYQPFERAFRKSGAVSMMTAYNAVNGVPCNLNPAVVEKAKKEWGCEFVVSDAGDITGTNREHHWFETMEEAVAASLRAGIDSITDDPDVCLPAVHRALDQGLLTIADVEKAVENSLLVRFRLGEFDPAWLNPYEGLGEDQIGNEAHRAVSLKAARQALVLLKNDQDTLPLKGFPRVAVVGPLAQGLFRDLYSGDYTHEETLVGALVRHVGVDRLRYESGANEVGFAVEGRPVGVGPDGAALVVGSTPTVFEAVDWGQTSHTFRDVESQLYVTTDDQTLRVGSQEIAGWFTKEVVLADLASDAALATWNGRPIIVGSDGVLAVGTSGDGGLGRVGIDAGTTGSDLEAVRHLCAAFQVNTVKDGVAAAVEAARWAEVAIVAVGGHPLINARETIDRPGLDLPPAQVELVKAVAAVNPRTVLVVVSGYPYALDDVLPLVSSVIHTTHAGPEMGQALVDTLWGVHNPSGRLPMTWYAKAEALPPLEDYDVMRSRRTYRWFGGKPLFPFGHGLGYTRFEYRSLEPDPSVSPLAFRISIANVGPVPGHEVVQLYAKVEGGPLPRPSLQLVAFRKVFLEPGQAMTFAFEVDPHDLRIWDVVGHRFTNGRASVLLAAGPSSADLRLTTGVPLEAEAVEARHVERRTLAMDFDDHSGVRIDSCREGNHAVSAHWLSFREVFFGPGAPQLVSIRVRSPKGSRWEFRWDRADGALAAQVHVGPCEGWVTVTSPVELWKEGGHLFLVSQPAGGREEGVAWFQFHK